MSSSSSRASSWRGHVSSLHHLPSPHTLLSRKPMCPFYRQESTGQRGAATFVQAKIICLPALPHVPEQNYLRVLTQTPSLTPQTSGRYLSHATGSSLCHAKHSPTSAIGFSCFLWSWGPGGRAERSTQGKVGWFFSLPKTQTGAKTAQMLPGSPGTCLPGAGETAWGWTWAALAAFPAPRARKRSLAGENK